MSALAGYRLLDQVAESATTVLLQGIRVSDGRCVLVKLIKEEHPPSSVIARLKAELELTRELRVPGLLEPLELVNVRYQPALVFESFTGTSLRTLLSTGPLDLPRFFDIAIPLADTLAELHALDVIHKQLAPEGILVDTSAGRIKLADLSGATRLARESRDPSGLRGLAQELTYISPEQTGRMNRTVDYRSDLYSLGAILYELLAGVPCFVSRDPMELVHCHLARRPAPPETHRPDCPPVLSRLVLKLLAKTAEDRYQSASGLAMDLRQASRRLHAAGVIDDFPLGQEDVPPTLSVPEKLYGRERELERLAAAVERVSHGGNELVLISGYSGIGKTSLVNELHRSLVARRGYLVSGNFEQLRSDTPYLTVVKALRRMLRLLMAEAPASVAAWKERLQAAIAPQGQLLVDLLPELELLLGPQPPVPGLQGGESQARFHRVFIRLISALTRPERPLVLFLDDMQWADPASLALLERLLADPDLQNLLLLCAYRENEVGSAHPFMLLVGQLLRQGRPVQELHVGPLNAGHVRHLLADTLRVEPSTLEGLADVVLAKTGGNPFFLNQLLRSLHAAGLLHFEQSTRSWRWDLGRIRQAPHTDNVVAFMAEKLRQLPPAEQDVLKLASCLGSSFTLGTLARLRDTSPEAVLPLVGEAVREGLLLPEDSSSVEAPHPSPEDGHPDAMLSGGRYRFAHDGVQQAAYVLIPEEERPTVHLRIGRLLWREGGAREEHGFNAINQLNLGWEGLETLAERKAVAELNLQAGRRAKASSAYAAAAAYLRVGARLLGEEGWQHGPELMWELTVERAECEYHCTHFEDAQAAFDLALARAQTRLQKAQVYKTQILLYTNQGRFLEACRCGIEALRLFGIDFPEDDARVIAMLERENPRAKLRGRTVEELAGLPEERDPDALAVGMLLAHLISPFYQGYASKHREWLATCLLVGQVLRTGRSSDAGTYGFATYGSQLIELGDYANGLLFGRLAVDVAEKYGFTMSRGRNLTLFGGIINHWVHPASTSSAYLERAFQVLGESGDLVYGVYACTNLVTLSFARGDALDAVEEEIQRYLDFVRQSRYQEFFNALTIVRQWVRCLKGRSEQAWSLPPPEEAAGTLTKAVWSLSQLKLLYLAGRYTEALTVGAESEQLIPVMSGSLLPPESRFFHALALAALGRGARGEETGAQLAAAVRELRRWAESCPANFRQQLLLVEAERSRLAGEALEAMHLYDAAIEAASEAGYLHVEALANELAGRFHLEGGRPRVARGYLREARYAYGRWGAAAKVAELEARYPELLQRWTTGTQQAPGVDLLAVTRSSQALSGEIHLRSLLEKLIRIVMESSGSERAVLLIARDGGWFIEAEATVEQAEATLLRSIPLEAMPELPRSVIHYVAHSESFLVLGNALGTAPYQADPYILERQVRSILCLPVVAHQKRVGLLYLEHRQAPDIFTSDRQHVLTLLSAQAAISLENALLYETLEQRVQARTRELHARNEQVAQALHQLQETQRLLVEKEKLAALGAVTASIAHEVKNPLNFINNFAALTQDLSAELRQEVDRLERAPSSEGFDGLRALSDTLSTFSAKISEHGGRVQHIIDSMSQLSAGNRAIRQPTDLNRLLAQHLTLASQEPRLRARAEQVQLTTHYDEDVGLVRVAPEELGRVFINLIRNAYQAALARRHEPPGQVPHVEVRTRDLGRRIEVRVKDNGVGIPPHLRPRIFSPFFTTKAPGEGTGLGLSLSHNIVVQLHGGELHFESTPGKGTEFIVTLPRD